jgi:transcriptional regulator CtsR
LLHATRGEEEREGMKERGGGADKVSGVDRTPFGEEEGYEIEMAIGDGGVEWRMARLEMKDEER